MGRSLFVPHPPSDLHANITNWGVGFSAPWSSCFFWSFSQMSHLLLHERECACVSVGRWFARKRTKVENCEFLKPQMFIPLELVMHSSAVGLVPCKNLHFAPLLHPCSTPAQKNFVIGACKQSRSNEHFGTFSDRKKAHNLGPSPVAL